MSQPNTVAEVQLGNPKVCHFGAETGIENGRLDITVTTLLKDEAVVSVWLRDRNECVFTKHFRYSELVQRQDREATAHA